MNDVAIVNQGTKPSRRKRKNSDGLALEIGGVEEFFPIDAIGSDGLMVFEDQTLATIVELQPPNIDMISEAHIEKCLAAFKSLLSLLEPGSTAQLLIEGSLLSIDEHLEHMRHQIELVHGFDPSVSRQADNPLTEAQESAYVIYQMFRDSVFTATRNEYAMHRRCFMVLRWDPNRTEKPKLLSGLPGPIRAVVGGASDRASAARVESERTISTHRRAAGRHAIRQSQFTTVLERQKIFASQLDGAQAIEYLRSRAQPTASTRGRLDRATLTDVLSSFERPIDLETAQEAARKLRGTIAQRPIEFPRSRPYDGLVDQDAVRTYFLAGNPSITSTFWTQVIAGINEPFTLSCFYTGKDRRAEQEKVSRRWRQASRENERNWEKGKPDPEAMAQEHEQAQFAQKMALDPMSATVDVSMYLCVRSSGPDPDIDLIDDVLHHASNEVNRVTQGGDLDRGHREQERLWRSTLPLGKDEAGHAITMETTNAADSFPLISTSVGSPTGIPLFRSLSGEMEYFNTYDRRLNNNAFFIAGGTGSGKTVLAQRIAAAIAAMGGRNFILDRAGHFDPLLELFPDARKVSLGTGSTEFSINHWDMDEGTRNNPEAYNKKVRALIHLHQLMLDVEFDRKAESLVADAIRRTYNWCALNNVKPTERHFVAILEAGAKYARTQDGQEGIARVFSDLAGQLAEFTGDGLYGAMWDRETNIPPEGSVVILDTSGAQESMLIPLLFATVEWIVSEARRMQDIARVPGTVWNNRPAVILDEGWAWAKVPELASQLNTLVRQSRHISLTFGVISQEASDFQGGAESVLNQASIKLLMRQTEQTLAAINGVLELSEREVNAVTDLSSTKGRFSEVLFMNGPRGTGRNRIIVGPLEYWAWTTEPTEDVPARKRMVEEHGGNFREALVALAREGIPAISK